MKKQKPRKQIKEESYAVGFNEGYARGGEDEKERILGEIGLFDFCKWWIETYPEDVFVSNPKEVVEIRRLAKEILSMRKE